MIVEISNRLRKFVQFEFQNLERSPSPTSFSNEIRDSKEVQISSSGVDAAENEPSKGSRK